MHEYLPILIAGGIIGVFSLAFIVLYVLDKRKKQVYEGYDRNVTDRELEVCLYHPLNVTDEKGGHDVVDNRGQHDQKYQNELLPVGSGIL